MKTFIIYLLSAYYLLGVICLPQNDFSVLMDLPEMYHHCKSYEEPDMDVFEFVADHLLNIEGMFDSNDYGSHEKPHQAYHYHHFSAQVYSNTQFKKCNIRPYPQLMENQPCRESLFPAHDCVSEIFHPPIVL